MPVMRSVDAFFGVIMNKLMNKQSTVGDLRRRYDVAFYDDAYPPGGPYQYKNAILPV